MYTLLFYYRLVHNELLEKRREKLLSLEREKSQLKEENAQFKGDIAQLEGDNTQFILNWKEIILN